MNINLRLTPGRMFLVAVLMAAVAWAANDAINYGSYLIKGTLTVNGNVTTLANEIHPGVLSAGVFDGGTAHLSGTSIATTINKGQLFLDGGSPTKTVAAGSVCVCSEATDSTKTVKCAVSSTTLTPTGTEGDYISYLCF